MSDRLFWNGEVLGQSMLEMPITHDIAERSTSLVIRDSLRHCNVEVELREGYKTVEQGLLDGEPSTVEHGFDLIHAQNIDNRHFDTAEYELQRVFLPFFMARAARTPIDDKTADRTYRNLGRYLESMDDKEPTTYHRGLIARAGTLALAPAPPYPSLSRERVNPINKAFNHDWYFDHQGNKVSFDVRYNYNKPAKLAPGTIMLVFASIANAMMFELTSRGDEFYGDPKFLQLDKVTRKNTAARYVSSLIAKESKRKKLDDKEQSILDACREGVLNRVNARPVVLSSPLL